jgi:hypothetical protein
VQADKASTNQSIGSTGMTFYRRVKIAGEDIVEEPAPGRRSMRWPGMRTKLV